MNRLRDIDPLWRLFAVAALAGGVGSAIVALAHGYSYWGWLALVGIVLLAAAFVALIWPTGTVWVPCVQCGQTERVDRIIAAAHEQWRCPDCWLSTIK